MRLHEQARLAISRGRAPGGVDPAAWWAVVERERPSPASIAARDVLPASLAVVSLGLVAARGGGDAAALWVLAGCWAIAGVVGVLWRLDQRDRADRLLGALAFAARDRPPGPRQDLPFQGFSRAAGPQDP